MIVLRETISLMSKLTVPIKVTVPKNKTLSKVWTVHNNIWLISIFFILGLAVVRFLVPNLSVKMLNSLLGMMLIAIAIPLLINGLIALRFRYCIYMIFWGLPKAKFLSGIPAILLGLFYIILSTVFIYKGAEMIYKPASPDSIMANSDTYTNARYGYLIKYPSFSYTQIICPGFEKDRFYLTKRAEIVENFKAEEKVFNASTCARDHKYFLELEVSDGQIEKPKSDQYMLVTSIGEEDILISNVKGKRYVVDIVSKSSPSLKGWYTTIHVVHKNKTYKFSYDRKENTVLIMQILSTFKFTNQ